MSHDHHGHGGGHAEPADHPSGHDKHARHSVAMFRDRFWLSLALTIPVVLYSPMIQEWFGYTAPVFPGSEWIPPVLGTVIFVYGGTPFLRGAAQEVRDRQPGMMLLIGMAITVAYVASLATTIGWFDLDFWWELAALITIMLLGHWMEMRAIGQARGALIALAELLPDEAERIVDGEPETVPISSLAVDDLVLVRPGARVPADGVITIGGAEMDESMVTGESRPVLKGPGDPVVAGTVAIDSAIRVQVRAVGDDTALAGIQRLVVEAQQSRSRAQVLADRGSGSALLCGGRGGCDHRHGVVGSRAARGRGHSHRLGPRHRLPSRPRACHPPGDLDLNRVGCAQRDPGQRSTCPRAHADGGRRALRQDGHPHPGTACGG